MEKLLLEKHRKRFFAYQKKKFRNDLKRELEVQGLEVEFDSGFLATNILIGNKKANNVLIAHYDTATNMAILYPFIKLFGLFYANIIISLFLLLLLFTGHYNLIMLFSLFLFLGLLIPNRYNFNDNSSGVISVLEFAIANKDNDDFLYVLTDNEEKGLIGALRLRKYLTKNNLLGGKKFLNIDCVATGEQIIVAAGSKNSYADEVYAKMTNNAKLKLKVSKSISSDHLVFKNQGAMLTRVDKALLTNDIYIKHIHTNKDREYHLEYMDYVQEELRNIYRLND